MGLGIASAQRYAKEAKDKFPAVACVCRVEKSAASRDPVVVSKFSTALIASGFEQVSFGSLLAELYETDYGGFAVAVHGSCGSAITGSEGTTIQGLGGTIQID